MHNHTEVENKKITHWPCQGRKVLCKNAGINIYLWISSIKPEEYISKEAAVGLVWFCLPICAKLLTLSKIASFYCKSLFWIHSVWLQMLNRINSFACWKPKKKNKESLKAIHFNRDIKFNKKFCLKNVILNMSTVQRICRCCCCLFEPKNILNLKMHVWCCHIAVWRFVELTVD